MAGHADALRRLKSVAAADVYKADTLAGRLERTDSGVTWSYDDQYLAVGGRPVATSLAPSRGVITSPSGAVPPFFAGLLPEGRRMSALRTAVKASADDELSLLLAVGADTIGDVRVFERGCEPTPANSRVEVTGSWSEVSFAEVFAADSGADPDRVGLPGAQPKASASVITIPVAAAGSNVMLKLDPPEYPHLVANEAAMLAAARLSGLSTVDADVVEDRDGRLALAVRRFDRMPDGTSRPVEDACQVLNRYPADKYT